MQLGLASRLVPFFVLAACANSRSEAKPPAASSPVVAPIEGTLIAKGGGQPSGGGDKAKEGDKGGGGKPAADKPATDLGLDLSGLDPSQVESLNRLLDEKSSVCGKGHSLRTSLRSDPACRRSGFAARYLVKMLKAGLLGSEAEELYDKRFVAPETGTCDATEAPTRGNAKAAITVCEFSDFQCPHCRLAEPILGRILEEYREQVRLIYKNFPLSRLHPEARDAAAAALAAAKQGKFWQMHDKLFANQDRLTEADLERYAQELKLDVKRWKADLPAAMARVDKDREEGEKLELSGTPTIYVNGRKYSGPLRYDEVKDWIDEELAR